MTAAADIITRNFFRMMRSGALNEYVDLEPMSAFKWQRLVEIVSSENVASVASRAVKNHQFEANFNMPQALRDEIHREAAANTGQSIRPELDNSMLNKRLKEIYTLETHSENCSKESLDLFNIIIVNCHAILSKGTSTKLIIRLGNYARINSDRIDYAKVERWLNELQMQKVAQLAGSILINNFAFKQEELPFVKKIDSKAATVMVQSIMQRRKAKHNKGITYFEYAPLENASIILRRLKSRLDTIEE
jgi:hypothetical protein